MAVNALLDNVLHPPVLFFLLGVVAVLVRSDLEIPSQIVKFLSLYLLFTIGIKGGIELNQSGLTPTVIKVMITCISFSFLIPFAAYALLRRKLDNPNAAAIAAAFGSVSAVTFATGITFLQNKGIPFEGYMLASMALMESPAIVSGLILYNWNKPKLTEGSSFKAHSKRKLLHEACLNGSVLLLVGSLIIGLLTGKDGEVELKPFITDIFKGMLCLYMLDMGLLAARRFKDLKQAGPLLVLFALLYPLVGSVLGITAAYLIGLKPGDALLLTILAASASYIAVPVAMRNAIPEANMSLLLPMALGITFPFNVVVGIPLYYYIINLVIK